MAEQRSELTWIENVERGNAICSNNQFPSWTKVTDMLDYDHDIPQTTNFSHQLQFMRAMKFKVGCARRFAALLNFGLQVENDGKVSKQLFDVICKNQRFDCLLLLMIRGMEVPEVIQERIPFIHYISQYSTALPVVEYMFDLDPTLNDYFTFVNWAPLTYACRSGSLHVVQYLISKGANPLHIDLGKKTLLHHAAINGGVDLIDLLLADGIPIDARDSNQKTALHHACELGNITLAEHLISRGADINAKDIVNSTPVKLAYCKDRPGIMHLLLTTHKAKLSGINWHEMFAGSASAQIAKTEYFHRILAIPRRVAALFRQPALNR